MYSVFTYIHTYKHTRYGARSGPPHPPSVEGHTHTHTHIRNSRMLVRGVLHALARRRSMNKIPVAETGCVQERYNCNS